MNACAGNVVEKSVTYRHAMIAQHWGGRRKLGRGPKGMATGGGRTSSQPKEYTSKTTTARPKKWVGRLGIKEGVRWKGRKRGREKTFAQVGKAKERPSNGREKKTLNMTTERKSSMYF